MIASTEWAIFEIVVNIVENLILMDCLNRCFPHKYTGKRHFGLFLLFYGLLFGTITVINFIRMADQYLIFLAFLYFVLFCRFALLGKWYEHVIVSILLILGIAVTANLALVLVTTFFDASAQELIYSPSFYRMTYVVIAKLLLFSFSRVLTQVKTKRLTNVSLRELIPAFIIPAFSIAILVFVMDALTFLPPSETVFCIVAIAAVIIINILVYYLIGKLNHQHDLEIQLVRTKQNEDLYLQEIKSAKKWFDQISQINHDLKNFSIGLKSLLEQGNVSEAIAKVDVLHADVGTFHGMVHSGNSFVDAIINSKLSQAQQHGIELHYQCHYNLGFVDELDLGRVLGNLLDNALEYLESHNPKQKTLHLIVTNKKNYLLVQVQNSIEESILLNNPNLKTTKANKKLHGLGLSSVQDLSKKYEGIVNFYEEHAQFTAVVMLDYLTPLTKSMEGRD